MRNGYSAAQIRAAEEPHLAAGEPLMQRAAAALADEVRALLRARGAVAAAESPSAPEGTSAAVVVVLVGTGNNGGDALFAGALLAADGVVVEIVPTGDRMHEDGLAAAAAAGARVHIFMDAASIASLVADADLVVDGILGTGSAADPAVRGRTREIVAAILPVVGRLLVGSPTRPLVVAVDIPSGIGADDGSVPDPIVLPADVTVTFGSYKAGLQMGQARRFTGLLKLVDIGLGPELEPMQPLVRGRTELLPLVGGAKPGEVEPGVIGRSSPRRSHVLLCWPVVPWASGQGRRRGPGGALLHHRAALGASSGCLGLPRAASGCLGLPRAASGCLGLPGS